MGFLLGLNYRRTTGNNKKRFTASAPLCATASSIATVPLAFCAAGGFPSSALCPTAGDFEEPLAQFWVGDQFLGTLKRRAGRAPHTGRKPTMRGVQRLSVTAVLRDPPTRFSEPRLPVRGLHAARLMNDSLRSRPGGAEGGSPFFLRTRDAYLGAMPPRRSRAARQAVGDGRQGSIKRGKTHAEPHCPHRDGTGGS
jgi:hypothetical protein